MNKQMKKINWKPHTPQIKALEKVKLRDDIIGESRKDLVKDKINECSKLTDKFILKTLRKLGFKGLLSEEIKLKNFIEKNNIEIANKNNCLPIITWILKDKEIKSVLIIYGLNLYGKDIDYREEFY